MKMGFKMKEMMDTMPSVPQTAEILSVTQRPKQQRHGHPWPIMISIGFH
jgi:hypothetical protein